MRISDWSSDVCSSDLAGLHPEALRHMAVDGDRVADPAVVAQVMAVAEILTYLGRAGEAPVVEHPGEVPVDAGRFRLLDDERPIEAPAALLEAADRKSTCRERVCESV